MSEYVVFVLPVLDMMVTQLVLLPVTLSILYPVGNAVRLDGAIQLRLIWVVENATALRLVGQVGLVQPALDGG